MRNIFDQYTQRENRLTHALAASLAEGRTTCQALQYRESAWVREYPGAGDHGRCAHASVWDYIPFQGSYGYFTSFPHLTLSIGRDNVGAFLSVPNGLERRFRRNLIGLGEEGFFLTLSQVNKSLSKVVKKAPAAIPFLSLVQRHYPTQRSASVVDASLEFDMRTAFPSSLASGVKTQKEWVSAAYHALENKKSNMHLAVGMRFPYGDGTVTNSVKILDRVVDSWISCKALVSVILAEEEVV